MIQRPCAPQGLLIIRPEAQTVPSISPIGSGPAATSAQRKTGRSSASRADAKANKLEPKTVLAYVYRATERYDHQAYARMRIWLVRARTGERAPAEVNRLAPAP